MLSDSFSIHTSISIEHGLEVISLHVTELRHGLPTIFSAEAILEGLQISMQENCFKFGDQFFKQIDGTRMVTSCACHHTTNYHGHKERKRCVKKTL